MNIRRMEPQQVKAIIQKLEGETETTSGIFIINVHNHRVIMFIVTVVKKAA